MSEEQPASAESLWHTVLTGEESNSVRQRFRHVFGFLPSSPRCRLCHRPFRGAGGGLMRIVLDHRPSQLNPHLCTGCAEFAARNEGVVEIQLSMLFADVRNSTALAETMSPSQFSQLISRFYRVTTDVLVRRHALIEKLLGDEVTGLFVPGFAGPQHASQAVKAATELLHATGHADREGPWVPVGVGVHTGMAHVGSVGSEDGVTDIVALGDEVNTAARIASQAGAGEVVLSETVLHTARLVDQQLEQRELTLKGKSNPMNVWVMRAMRN